ncbi:hypothetical protein D1155_08330 [Anaerotruncus sp. 80]|uniref:Transposase and inactivated derivatives n=1 Tax=Anaerotruncus colihominis TaxID=169435 RepID=A0A845QJM5_9FIRM|nr:MULTISPECIES: hypothetical protein [Anaerotruncus]NBH61654.1 hypothetical protein [Anaerotruncus colihominis]NCF02309.1 hypothetical protein [Anaerotruncus sp. 80]
MANSSQVYKIDFIITLLNVTTSGIANCFIKTDHDTIHYEITLVRKPKDCPFCGGLMIEHGHKVKIINHPALRNTSGVIVYRADRYLCKDCKRTSFQEKD